MTDLNKDEQNAKTSANDKQTAFETAAWLAAVVENSDDAIITKTLDGVIMTWNRGAERLFGYTAAEAIGKPITLVIPADRHHEEDNILRRLRAGERIDHFETVRQRKDGTFVEVSLTVSPVRNAAGEILGASKIARDITAQKRAHAQQSILLREMHHRIKNLFSLAGALIKLSSKASNSVAELTADLTARMHALARAHALTLPDLSQETASEATTTFKALLEAILEPHEHAVGSRISITGTDVPLGGNPLTSVALLLHELATNAAKYGALAVPSGHLVIDLGSEDEIFRMTWRENGGPTQPVDVKEGFGSTLERAALQGIGGSLSREWHADGVGITLEAPVIRLGS